MSELNLFWPVYKNLEKEVLKLADYIHFSDDQTKVYSMHIADLIVRCSIEIEAISKELYLKLGGNTNPINNDGSKRDLYFDTDCLDLLETNWKLSKKQVMISANTFYFIEEKNKVLSPFYKANKRGTSGSKWKQAYQAIKHSRKVSLKKATIENLLNAMGALYILNLYYKDECIKIEESSKFDMSLGSDIFSIFTYKILNITESPYMDDKSAWPTKGSDLNQSTYIIKYTDESFRIMHRDFCRDYKITLKNYRESTEIQNFLRKNPDYNVETISKTCIDIGGIDLHDRIVSRKYVNTPGKCNVEAILNKHTNIYPTLTISEEEII